MSRSCQPAKHRPLHSSPLFSTVRIPKESMSNHTKTLPCNIPQPTCHVCSVSKKKVLYTKAKHPAVNYHTKACLHYLSITHRVFKYVSYNILIGSGKFQVSSFVYLFCKGQGLFKVNRTETGRTAPGK